MSTATGRVINNGSMAANITGSPTVMPGSGNGSVVTYLFNWPATGTPVGTLGFDVSNNFNSQNPTDASTVWVDSGYSVVTNPNGAADNSKVLITVQGFQAIRPKYTRGSGGTGALLTCDVHVRGQ